MGMTDQDRAILISFVICVVVLLILQALFEFLRKRVRVVYEPRTFYEPKPLPEPARGIFAWVIPTFKIDEQEILEKRGLDVLVYLRVLRSTFYLFAFITFWSWVVLAPINGTGSNKDLPDGDELKTVGLPIVFMSNIETGSYRLIAHALTCWIFSLLLLFLYYKDYRLYWKDRMWCFAQKDRQNFSVLVRSIPFPNARSKESVEVRENQIRDKFGLIFGEATIQRVDAVWTEPELKENVKKYNEYVPKLEKAYVVHQLKGERPTHKLGPLGLWGEEVDSIEWYNEQLTKLKKEIEAHHSAKEVNFSKVAIVTFSTRKVTSMAAHGVIDRQRDRWNTIPAPEPDDVFWDWLDMRDSSKFVRRALVNVFMFFLVFFWSIPVLFAASLANLEKISQTDGFGWVGDIINANKTVGSFLQGFLPALVVIIFFAILQMIITKVSTLEAYPSLSYLDRVVSMRLYFFQLFNIFLIYTIAGSFLTEVESFISNVTFGSIIDLLAKSIPQQALFFSNFIMLKAFIGTSMILFNPGRLIVRWIFRKFLCKTQREFDNVDKPTAFNYAGSVSMSFLILAIALSYSVMNPLVVTVACFYYAYMYVAIKYMLLYVNLQPHEGRGFLWPVVQRAIIIALMIFQILMIGVFLIYKVFAAAAICIPLPFVTLGTHFVLKGYFRKPCHQGALGEMAPLDVEFEETTSLTKTQTMNNPELEDVLVPVNSDRPKESTIFDPFDYYQPERKPLEPIPTGNTQSTV